MLVFNISKYYAVLPVEPTAFYLYNIMQVASVCFSKTLATARMVNILGGNVNDRACSSVGGALRRLSYGVEMQLATGQVAPILGAALLFSADWPARSQFLSMYEGSTCGFPCHECHCKKNNFDRTHDFLRFPDGDEMWCPIRAHADHIDTVSASAEKGRGDTKTSVHGYGTPLMDSIIPWAESVKFVGTTQCTTFLREALLLQRCTWHSSILMKVPPTLDSP
jgi:hypothetical protein